MCFLLSLGNRSQGSKWGYTLEFIGFGFVTIYMTVAAFLLAYKGIQSVAQAEARAIQLSDLFTNSIFTDVVLSSAATLGLYIVISLIFFEPWHMITSFLHYLLMAPSYIAALNVYAFANVHDVSWGMKGVNTDLGVVSAGKGENKNEVEVASPRAETDTHAAYEDAIHVLSSKAPKTESKPDPATQQGNYKAFRTNALLVWTLSNAFLAAVITVAAGGTSGAVNGYMAFISSQ